MTREEQLKYEYENKLAALKREQASCDHVWQPTAYDPEIQKIPRYEDRWVGVDYMPAICGYSEKKIDRWSRTCVKCGKVEYTKILEPVAIKAVPKFN